MSSPSPPRPLRSPPKPPIEQQGRAVCSFPRLVAPWPPSFFTSSSDFVLTHLKDWHVGGQRFQEHVLVKERSLTAVPTRPRTVCSQIFYIKTVRHFSCVLGRKQNTSQGSDAPKTKGGLSRAQFSGIAFHGAPCRKAGVCQGHARSSLVRSWTMDRTEPGCRAGWRTALELPPPSSRFFQNRAARICLFSGPHLLYFPRLIVALCFS